MHQTIYLILKQLLPILVVTDQITIYTITIRDALLPNVTDAQEWYDGIQSAVNRIVKMKEDYIGYDIPKGISDSVVQLEYQSEVAELMKNNNLGKGSNHLINGLADLQEGDYPHRWDVKPENMAFNITSFINEVIQSTGNQPVGTVIKINGEDINIITPNKNIVNMASKCEDRLATLGYTTEHVETKQKSFYEIYSLNPIVKKSLIIGTVAGIGYIIYKTL